MGSILSRGSFFVVVALVGCGGAPPPPAEAPPSDAAKAKGAAQEESSGGKAEPSAEEKAEEEAARQIPTTCEEQDKLCLPPAAFVKRLCGGFHPDVALSLLAKGTPFTRGYLTRETEAWNASGGASSSSKLLFDEEVLLLYRRVPDTGGMVVSGAGGGYDVLRWDGTCASLTSDEVRLRVPPKPRYATIPWKSLDPKTRELLEADEKVGKAIAERRKECKGATMGSVSAQCEKVDRKMSEGIVVYVRGGGALPKLGPLP